MIKFKRKHSVQNIGGSIEICTEVKKGKNKKYKFFVYGMLLMIVPGLSACGGRHMEYGSEASPTYEERENNTGNSGDEEWNYEEEYEEGFDEEFYQMYDYISTEEESAEPLFDTNQRVNILFAGNSLLKTPGTFFYFRDLVDRYHLPADTERELWDGMNIRYQLSLAASSYDEVAEEYKKADIVLLQEYGTRYETTYADICELIEKYCKEDVIVYYYTTEFDEPWKYLKEISDDERIHIIDFGAVQDKLNQIPIQEEEKTAIKEEIERSLYGNHRNTEEYNEMSEYDVTMYEFLHLSGDYHPNELNGFLAAAYIYTQIYKTDFYDYGYDELDDSLKKMLPGLTDEAKEGYYSEMIRIVNEGAGHQSEAES